MQRHLVVLLLITTFLFALHDATLKYLSAFYAVSLLVWARYVVQLVMMLLAVAPSMGRAIIVTRHPRLMVFRALMQVSTALFVQLALKHLPLAETAALVFVSPLIVALLSGAILGEQLGLRNWLVTGAGFVGVLLIARPGGALVGIGVAYALSAALSSALYQIFTRKLAVSEPPMRQLFYSTLVGAIAMSLLVPEYWDGKTPSPTHAGLFVAAAVCVAVGHFLFIHASRETPAATLSTLLYIKLIWAALLGLLIFDQLPDLFSVAGMLIIGASGLSLALYRPRAAIVNLSESQ